MTVLYIILAVIAVIILILVVLLHFSVKAYIDADKSHVNIIVKYLGFMLYKLDVPDRKKDSVKEASSTDEPEITLEEVPQVDAAEIEDSEEIQKKVEEAQASDMIDENVTLSAPTADELSEQQADSSESDDFGSEKPEEKKQKPTLSEMWNEYKKYIPAGKKAFRKLLKLIRLRDLRLELIVGNDDPYKAGLNFGRINAAVYSILGFLCSTFSVTIDHTEIKCDYEHKALDFNLKTAVLVRPSAVFALAVYLGVYYLKIKHSMKKLEKIAKAKENSK